MPMTRACYATAHWLRYPQIRMPGQLPLHETPPQCLSWKIGPDGPVGADGRRLPSEIWCGVGLFRIEEAARSAFSARDEFLPLLTVAVESWHVLLIAVAHRGECNYLDAGSPGLVFEPGRSDPGGSLIVMTTAGFDPGPELDFARVVDFRRNVDRVKTWLQFAPGRVASQVFTPYTPGDDGVTMSIWCDDAAMTAVMYRAGAHRE